MCLDVFSSMEQIEKDNKGLERVGQKRNKSLPTCLEH